MKKRLLTIFLSTTVMGVALGLWSFFFNPIDLTKANLWPDVCSRHLEKMEKIDVCAKWIPVESGVLSPEQIVAVKKSREIQEKYPYAGVLYFNGASQLSLKRFRVYLCPKCESEARAAGLL